MPDGCVGKIGEVLTGAGADGGDDDDDANGAGADGAEVGDGDVNGASAGEVAAAGDLWERLV